MAAQGGFMACRRDEWRSAGDSSIVGSTARSVAIFVLGFFWAGCVQSNAFADDAVVLPSADSAESLTFADILGEWSRRTTTHKSVYLTWDGEERIVRRRTAPQHPTGNGDDESVANGGDSGDEPYALRNTSLWIVNRSMRFERPTSRTAIIGQEMRSQSSFIAGAGEDKALWPLGNGEHQGAIKSLEVADQAQMIENVVPVLMFRPLELFPMFGLDEAETANVTVSRDVVGERQLPKLRFHGGPIKYTLVVDDAHDYRPVVLTSETDSTRTESTAEYDDDEATQVWRPKSWSVFIGRETGGSGKEYTAVVTDYKLDLPQSEDEIEVQFPVGTLVSDLRSGKEYVVGPNGEEFTKKPKKPPAITPETPFGVPANPTSQFADAWNYAFVLLAIVAFVGVLVGLYRAYSRRAQR